VSDLAEALAALAGMMRLVGHREGARDALLPLDRQPDPETREAMRVLAKHDMLDLGGVDQ
jgi:hypothetical protein